VRPSRLVLENFGPYRERAEVDFSRLGQVFLVCGQTGSGKTSLFDAMTYALYGKAPGARGGLERQLWSQYARPGERPLVEFEFFLGGAEYRALRSPPYRRKSQRRKDELVEVDAEAAFYRRESGLGGPEWKLLANSKAEVDAAIEEMIGLTEDEFSKIILLPQGEFQRFLEMKSSDRVEVLEKLFPVGIHDAVTALARDKAKAVLAAVQRVDAELDRLGGAGGTEVSADALRELEAEAQFLEAARAAAIERLSAAELAQGRAREAAARAQRERAAREKLAALESLSAAAAMRDERISAARRASAAVAVVDARETLSAELEAGLSSLAARRDQVAELVGRGSAIEAWREEAGIRADEAAAIDRELGELEAAGKAWAEASAARVRLAMARKEGSAIAARAEAARKAEDFALAARDKSLVGAEEEASIRAAFDRDRAASESADEALKAAEAAASAADKALLRRAAALATALETRAAAARLAQASEACAAIEAAEASGLAASLARSLEPGAPCPVCGSRDHPAPAYAAEGAASALADATDMNRLREDARAAKDEALAAEADARAKEKAAEARAVEVERELYDLAPEASPLAGALDAGRFAAVSAEAKSAARGADEALALSLEKLRNMERRRLASTSLSDALEGARALRAKADAEAQKSALDVARSEAALESAAASAGQDDPGPKAVEARSRRIRAAAERERLESAISSLEAERHKAEGLASELGSRVDILGLRLEEASRSESSALAEAGFDGPESARAARIGLSELASLEAEAANYRSDAAAARSGVEAIAAEVAASASMASGDAALDEESLAAVSQTARDSRDELQARFDAARAKAAALARARDERAALVEERRQLDADWSRMNLLSALLNGEMQGRRLPFKNYALGSYFRVVVERASERLAQMSDGRFALAADEGSGRGKAGLELLVRDAHTGQSRPSGTLSGGERFMTSLSLALGLADTIRERSGGASLDAIFIDEGFGSLDDEALDRAISVLDDARGGRTIGIVSHVAELKARMPSRIEVSKGRSGSSLRVVS